LPHPNPKTPNLKKKKKKKKKKSEFFKGNQIDHRFKTELKNSGSGLKIDIEKERERNENRVIAIDMSKADFGGVFESAISFSPSL
jgi:hypothetical protein